MANLWQPSPFELGDPKQSIQQDQMAPCNPHSAHTFPMHKFLRVPHTYTCEKLSYTSLQCGSAGVSVACGNLKKLSSVGAARRCEFGHKIVTS